MRPFLLNSASSLLVYHVALTSSLVVLGSVSMRVENVENLTRFLLPVGSNMNRFIFVFVIGCITLQLICQRTNNWERLVNNKLGLIILFCVSKHEHKTNK